MALCLRNKLLLCLFLPLSAHAQMWERLGTEQTSIDTTKVNRLEVAVDALTFFRDNEYDTQTQDGYTLPGAWMRPTVNYNPTGNIHLELGMSALFFDGANRYPCYAYHDIGHWKGNQYQAGAHILPWIRAQVDMGNTSFVFGDIYGAQNHGFITPLYNPEQLLSADPEAGFQILHRGRRFCADLYVNWQSYQFEEDTHQEAFTVGGDFQYRLSKQSAIGEQASADSGEGLKLHASILLQHRGGEQDIPELGLGVQTVYNGSIGIEHKWHTKVMEWKASADVLGCYQQSGSLWSFNSGIAYHAAAGVTILNDISIEAGHLYSPKQFISLYGNPFFSTYSIRKKADLLSHVSTTYMQADYSHTWNDAYTFGAGLEVFRTPHDFAFSFGAYFRFHPKFKVGKKE